MSTNFAPATNTSKTTTSREGRDLVLTRVINAPREKVFAAWTEPELIKQWFAPAPWTTPRAETDVRPGGASVVVMRGPDGNEFPCRGVYLEVVKNESLVFTDAYTEAWVPSDKPFMTVVLTFEDQAGKTKYTARACATGRWMISMLTKKWDSIKAGLNAPNNWRRWSRNNNASNHKKGRVMWKVIDCE